MRAIDTNVVARFLLDDDRHQAAIARSIVAEGVLIPATVLLETAWLLSSRYRFTPTDAVRLLLELIDLAPVTVPDADDVRWALERAATSGDLADLLHVAGAQGASSFATFDRGVAAAAGDDAPVAVETLA